VSSSTRNDGIHGNQGVKTHDYLGLDRTNNIRNNKLHGGKKKTDSVLGDRNAHKLLLEMTIMLSHYHRMNPKRLLYISLFRSLLYLLSAFPRTFIASNLLIAYLHKT
jgi:hypothetical protein